MPALESVTECSKTGDYNYVMELTVASSKATPTDTTLLRDEKRHFWTDFPKSAPFLVAQAGFWWIRRGNGFETLDSSWLPFVRGSVGADDEGSFEGEHAKNHETRESILRTDFAGLGERDGKVPKTVSRIDSPRRKTVFNTPCESAKTKKVIHIVVHRCG